VVAGTVARPPGASKTEHFAGSATVPTKKRRLLKDLTSGDQKPSVLMPCPLPDLLCDRSGNFTRLDSKGGSCYKGEKKKLKMLRVKEL
jgi:hypothetical protein